MSSLHSSRAALLPLFMTGVVLLIQCGQDTPITLEASRRASWPDTITGTPFNASATPDLAPALGLPPAAQSTPFGVDSIPMRDGTPLPTETRVRPDAVLTLPVCAPAMEQTVEVPESFPSFPFPPGLKLFIARTLNDHPNHLQVVGYAPLSLRNSVSYMLDELPKAGYQLGRGDAEPGEAEATFSGNGWRGGFRVAALSECADTTEWVIIVLKQ